jgi:hypothetical protein
MPKKNVAPGVRPKHMNQPGIFQEKVHDSYKSRGKLPEPTVCPQCGAVFHAGRGNGSPNRKAIPNSAACHRIHDRFPAVVTMEGAFLRGIVRNCCIARNVEQKERPSTRSNASWRSTTKKAA